MRITLKFLEAQITRLNNLTNSPETPWRKADGKLRANIGNYHLDQAYGGCKLVRMHNEGGAIEDVLHTGYVGKREVSNAIDGFIRGIHAGKELA